MLDAEGYLTITDRKEDVILTSVVKRVAPQSIESELGRHSLVAEAVLVGNRRKFVAALIVPDPAVQDRLAALHRLGGTRDALVARPDVIALFQEAVDAGRARTDAWRPTANPRTPAAWCQCRIGPSRSCHHDFSGTNRRGTNSTPDSLAHPCSPRTNDGADVTLEIESDEGLAAILRLRTSAQSNPVNGVLRSN